MRFLLVLLALLMSSPTHAEKRGGTICYFSLNNPKEAGYMQKMAEKLNSLSGTDIKVIEYLPDGQSPEVAFTEMVRQNAKCDGLVISGHHYGQWEGLRANGSLKIDFLEKLSCDPRYASWFKNLNSVHLQGCRSVGAGDIVANNPDDHTVRVNRLTEEDSIEQQFTDLNYGFTNILSRTNPLSARYLKVFPRATLFGWTDTAPGVKSRSELSLLYHIAHMAKINKPYLKLTDPSQEISKEYATELANAVLDMLQKPDWDRCESASIMAWEKHNPLIKDLKGFRSFESAAKKNPKLAKAKDLGCRLKFPANETERIQVLKEILQDKDFIAENFNFIMELKQGSHRNQILPILKSSGQLKSFVGDAVNAKEVGLFVKIDYYTFYKDVFGERSPAVENIISSESLKVLTKKYPADQTQTQDLVDFKRTLTSSLADNGYVDREFMAKLYNYHTKESDHMYRTLFNKLRVNQHHPNPTLVNELKPIADSIPPQ